MNYYIAVRDEQKGPYTRPQLETMWRTGVLTADTLYCAEGMTEWRKIEELVQLPNSTEDQSSATADPASQFLNRLKRLTVSCFKSVSRHGHRITISLVSITLVVYLSIVAFSTKSFWIFAIPLQGLVPEFILGGGTLKKIAVHIFTLTVAFLMFRLAWKRRQWTTTILFCVIVFLSVTLGMERALLQAKVLTHEFEKFEKFEKSVASSVSETILGLENIKSSKQRDIEKKIAAAWQQELEKIKQGDFDDKHSFIGKATHIADTEVSVNFGVREDILSYTLHYTIYWQKFFLFAPNESGYSKVQIVYDVENSRVISHRVLESSGETTRPIGAELSSSR